MKILIVRLSAIGDIFFCTALLEGLKREFPGCEVSWLTEPMGGQILEGHPLLDHLLVVPRRDWVGLLKRGSVLKLSRELFAFVRELRREPFDLVIDPQGLFKSAIWAKLAHGERVIGVNGSDGSRILYDVLLTVPRLVEPPMLSEYRLIVRGLGGNPSALRMSLHVSEEAMSEVNCWLPGGVSPVVFCPFTTRPQKHWPDSYWSELGNLVEAEGGVPVVILGGPDDGERAATIAKGMRVSPIIAAGERRSIHFALGVLKRAGAVVGVDTGLTHAGIALGKPTLALFGSTRPYVKTDVQHAQVLYKDLPCAPCRRHPVCSGRFDCMRNLLPSEVSCALKRLTGL